METSTDSPFLHPEKTPVNERSPESGPSSRRRLGVAIVAVAVSSLACALVKYARFPSLKNHYEIAGQTSPAGRAADILRSDSPFLNVDPGVAYVGSEACLDCHSQEHQSYLDTAHSRAFSDVHADQEPPAGSYDHPLSNRRYRIEKIGDRLVHTEFAIDGGQQESVLSSFPLTFRVGSGRFGRTYLARTKDGFLVESPITWYESRHRWDMSPGYDQPTHYAFAREVSTGCLFCHTGRTSIQESDYRPNIVERNIGCERCHGPGSLHVQKQLSAASVVNGIDYTIVNPRHIPRALGEAICQQCHLQGDVHVRAWGRRLDEFRPGLPLTDFQREYRLHRIGERIPIVGHVEQLHASECYRQSETLTCVTCHDPHHRVAGDAAVARYRAACVSCHQKQKCRVPLPHRIETAKNNCVQCHMPATETEVPHVAFTHHQIAVHPIEPPTTETEPIHLVPMQESSRLSTVQRNRSLGLGYLKSALRVREDGGDLRTAQELWAHARSLLDPLAGRTDNDAALEEGLARIAFEEGDSDAAFEIAGRVLAMDGVPTDERASAFAMRAEILFQRGKYGPARDAFRKLTQLRRRARDWFFLGLVNSNLDSPDAAVAALNHALQIDPQQAGAHGALAAIYEAQGDDKKAAVHRQRARGLAVPKSNQQ